MEMICEKCNKQYISYNPKTRKFQCVTCENTISEQEFTERRNKYRLRHHDVANHKWDIFKVNTDDEEDELWCTEMTEEDALYRISIETDAYDNDPEFQFYFALKANKC